MRPLELNYLSQPVWVNRKGLLLLAFAVLVAGGVLTLYLFYADQNAALQTRWNQLERSQQQLSAQASRSSGTVQEIEAEIRRANEVTSQLDLPWSQLFQAVEASSHETVALLGIQPDARKHVVNIAAEAKDMPSAVEYVKRLARQPILAEVYILNHQVQEQEPQRPIRFSVQAVWRERVREK